MSIQKKGVSLIFILVIFLLIISLTVSLISTAAIVSAAEDSEVSDVAYLYSKSSKIDHNIIDVFNELGLSVDTIQASQISQTNLGGYRLIFVGDERFPNPSSLSNPISDHPSIISNYYHGYDLGLTDRDGISKLVGSEPLSVTTSEGNTQVYTQAHYRQGSSIAIPYYYLDDNNKASGFEKIAGTNIGANQDFGDVISYAEQGTMLENGRITNDRMCFYGIIKSDYWTPSANELFKDCVGFVVSACSDDSDCSDSSVGEPYCTNKSVYRDQNTYTCENPNTINAACVADATPELVEICQSQCLNGGCVECLTDNDCDDSNNRTQDSCTQNNICEHNPIPCASDNDCDDSNPRTVDQCLNPGTTQSQCLNTEVNCLLDSDCGATGFIGQEFCSLNDVYKNYQTASCVNPGTLQSNCFVSQNPQQVNDCNDNNDLTSDSCSNGTCVFTSIGECSNDNDCGNQISNLICSNNNVVNRTITPDCTAQNTCNSITNDVIIEQCANGCSNGACNTVDIICSTDSQCNDGNARTYDECVNRGTSASFCRNTEVNCLSNSDCGITGFIGEEFCSLNNIYKNYQTSICNNPETLQSNCVVSQNPQQVNDCNDGNAQTVDSCSNGQCLHNNLECINDAQCNDNNQYTTDQCINNQCEHHPIPVCGNGIVEMHEQCDDGNLANGDGCSSQCKLENAQCQEICSGGAIDFELVIDRSGSMNRWLDPPENNRFERIIKIQSARDAAKTLVQSALDKNNQTKIGISTFSTDVNNEIGLTNNLDSLNYIITRLYANGNADTNYNESIKSAVDKLKTQGRLGSPKIIIFLSDGTPTVVNSQDGTGTSVDLQDIQSSLDAANYARQNNIILITVGFGRKSELNESLLNQMAVIGRGKYFFAGTHPEIIDLYGNMGNNTCQIVCTNLTIACSSNADCSDNNAYTNDICVNPGEPESYCRYEPIICQNNNDCNDGNSQTSDICVNPGQTNSFCRHDILQCVNDEQCGSVETIRMCNGNNIIDRITTPDCVANSCTSTTNDVFVEQCVNGCSNGACNIVNIICSTDIQCNDNNQRTIDRCVNPNTQNSYCTNTEVNCLLNSDCGATGYIGDNFCSLNDVYRIYQTASCLNGGTLQSSCFISQTSQQISDCNDGNVLTTDSCSNGQCLHNTLQCVNDGQCNDNNQNTQDRCINNQCVYEQIICFTNSDCNDNNAQTNDICVNPGTVQSFCSYQNIQCFIDSECNDNNQLTRDRCINPGTVQSFCVNDPLQCVTNNDCNDNNQFTQDLCTNNQCVHNTIICFVNSDCNDGNAQTNDICVNPGQTNSYCRNDILQCINDAQCGSQEIIRMCNGNNVINRITTPDCTSQNTCSLTTNDVTIQQCVNGCSNGQCNIVNIICSTDIQCNDNNQRTIDRCVNPNTQNSYCTNTEVNCLLNSDCGETGYIGENFCSTNSVYRIYQTASCLNAGTLQSSCLIAQRNDLINSCNDGNPQTVDSCNNGMCINTLQEICDNRIDDDNDGLIDYADVTDCNVIDCASPRIIKSVLGGTGAGAPWTPNNKYENFKGCCLTNQCYNGNPTLGGCYNNGGTVQYVDGRIHMCSVVENTNSAVWCNNTFVNDGNGNCVCPAGTGFNPATKKCEDQIITCYFDSQCNDNNAYTRDVCVNPGQANSFCRHDILQCIQDSDCGTVTAQNFCSGNNIIRRTTTPDCTATNNCTSTTTETILTTCAYGCSNAQCIPSPTCTNDEQCNDNNQRTIDRCVNPNTQNSYCTNTEVNCLLNSDCGETGYIGENFCSLNDVYRMYQTASCVNPGTLQSNCVLSQTSQQISDCNDGNVLTTDSCSNGQCLHNTLECVNDGQCNDNNQNTQDRCINNQCVYEQIICFTNSDCNDNNAQTNDICVNPGQTNSFCRHDVLQCINDAQCGNQEIIRMCNGNNVIDRITTPDCTAQNICSSTTNDVLVEQCVNGCSNGVCNIPEQIILDIPGADSNAYTTTCQMYTQNQYAQLNGPVNLSGNIVAGKTYNFYCTYGSENQPGNPTTIVLDNQYRTLEIGNDFHRRSQWGICNYIPREYDLLNFCMFRPQPSEATENVIAIATDKYSYKIALINGEIKIRVYRDISGLYITNQNTAQFSYNNLCPEYNIGWFDFTTGLPYNDYETVDSGLNFYIPGIPDAKEWKSVRCEVRGV